MEISRNITPKEQGAQWLGHVQLFATPRTVAMDRLLCPWDFPGKNTGVGYHFLLQATFLTQGSNRLQCLLHSREAVSAGRPVTTMFPDPARVLVLCFPRSDSVFSTVCPCSFIKDFLHFWDAGLTWFFFSKLTILSHSPLLDRSSLYDL